MSYPRRPRALVFEWLEDRSAPSATRSFFVTPIPSPAESATLVLSGVKSAEPPAAITSEDLAAETTPQSLPITPAADTPAAPRPDEQRNNPSGPSNGSTQPTLNLSPTPVPPPVSPSSTGPGSGFGLDGRSQDDYSDPDEHVFAHRGG